VFLIHPLIFKYIFEAHHGYDFPCLCQPLSTIPITTNMYYTASQEFTHVNTNNLYLVVISYQLAMVSLEGLEVITSLKMSLVQLIVLLQ
jgi:hypothetical protein